MANRKKQRSNELDNLKEDLGPYYHPSSQNNMSQRNRSGRGSNRHNGNAHGEEVHIWQSCQAQMNEIVQGINRENDNLGQLVDADKAAGKMDADQVPTDALKSMEQMCRNGVKFSEANVASLKGVMEQLKILRAVVVAKEQAEAPASAQSKRASARDSVAAAAAVAAASAAAAAASSSSLYDFDGAGDSPVPSPMAGSSTRKHAAAAAAAGGGDRGSNRDRDSIPPKADSAEPQSQAAAGGAAAAKSKVVFSKGDAVAFKPKAANGEQASDWILGEVAQVMGENKSRRSYRVLDIEPDDQSKQKEYRSSANSMIAITPEDQAGGLRDYEAGQVVLALYPNTTTFYKAEVHSMAPDGKVDLKFEGENDSTTLQQVERRFVIEYRP